VVRQVHLAFYRDDAADLGLGQTIRSPDDFLDDLLLLTTRE